MICGENISNYLIAKQKEIASKKIITSMTTEDNEVLNEYKKFSNTLHNFLSSFIPNLSVTWTNNLIFYHI